MDQHTLPLKVVVEVATPAVVARLEKENALLREDVKSLTARVERLHRTFYEYLEAQAAKARRKI